MASLYIKDSETAALVARVAQRTGVTKTALVRELAAAREAELDRAEPRASAREKLDALWREFPFPRSKGTKVDKAFFDKMWGEDED
ncbi:MAG: type II toxin-antitoxin system VapB family antitoxin [Sphingomonas sp.]|jgi:antitoxin VapB|nr:type II toxin-antitoxin system VapB family antitoxin [Sphingomonas sp.]